MGAGAERMYDFRRQRAGGAVRRIPSSGPGRKRPALRSLDRIKREKGVWWMPWQQEAMKDVIPCDKLRGAGNRL